MRYLKLAVLFLARALGLFAIARAYTDKGVRILCYHGLWLADDAYKGDAMFMRKATFAERLAKLRALGHPVITLDEAVTALRGNLALPPAPVVITIDDGWYSTFSEMAPMLRAERMPATLYCDTANLQRGKPIAHMMARYIHIIAGSPELDGALAATYRTAIDPGLDYDTRWAATVDLARHLGVDIGPLCARRAFDYMTPDELVEMASDGLIDVQLHSHNHTIGDMSLATIRSEVAANANALAAILNRPPQHFRHFCYPSGLKSPSAQMALDQLGLMSSTAGEAGFAYTSTPMQALPRFTDGDNVFWIEFEAELSGFMCIVRSAIAAFRSNRFVAIRRPQQATST